MNESITKGFRRTDFDGKTVKWKFVKQSTERVAQSGQRQKTVQLIPM
jgi:hypothetical protein